MKLEEDDKEVEVMSSNPSPSIPKSTFERKTKSQVWIFFEKIKEENKVVCKIF